mmetsp:Transcript_87751/g.152682  ORF Transcript_87751/g.152682 Transcript_87751/m.152682 type:complete len:137 (-) Transcript_87751:842-1252(-)
MKPAWDDLANQYEGSKSVIVGDVDCTVEKDLCSEQGVSGYPTIKYWVDGEKQDYQGGRDLPSLQSFTEETLDKTKCNVETLADCSKKEIKYIEKAKGWSKEQRAEKLSQVEKLKGNKFTKDAKFVGQRIAILKQLD